jgi:hypothetical protein
MAHSIGNEQVMIVASKRENAAAYLCRDINYEYIL